MSAQRIVHLLWNALPSLLAFVFAVWFIANLLIPNSYWIELNHIHVDDADVDQSPQIHLDLDIHRSFVLHWSAQVRRQDNGDAAAFTQLCAAHGDAPMYPGQHFPRVIDVNWWIKPYGCFLPKGTYTLDAQWDWEEYGFHRTMEVHSNIFHIPPDTVHNAASN